MPEVRIYFENQDAMLCGVHSLNSLLQGPIFTAVDLGMIAQELDDQERSFMLEGGISTDALKFLSESSGNVDPSGNFSIQGKCHFYFLFHHYIFLRPIIMKKIPVNIQYCELQFKDLMDLTSYRGLEMKVKW